VYQLQIKGIVLYCWSFLRCVEISIVIYCRGLKFPHRAVVVLVLESNGACTGLNGHCARTSAVLVLVCCYKASGDREHDLWRYWQSEGCIKQRCDRASGDGCQTKKCELWEQWSSDLAICRTLAKHSDIQIENVRCDSLWLSLLTGFHIDKADSSLLPLLFLRSLSILSGCSYN
jgi:hypothetical protein